MTSTSTIDLEAITGLQDLLNTSPYVARVSFSKVGHITKDCVRFAVMHEGTVAWLKYQLPSLMPQAYLYLETIQQTDPEYAEWVHGFAGSPEQLASATRDGHQLAVRHDGTPVPLVSFQVVSLLDRCLGALSQELRDHNKWPSGGDNTAEMERLHFRFTQFWKEQRQPLCQINGL